MEDTESIDGAASPLCHLDQSVGRSSEGISVRVATHPRDMQPSCLRQTYEVEYLVTSLSCRQVFLEQITWARRRHRTSENVTHYPRDVSIGKDRC